MLKKNSKFIFTIFFLLILNNCTPVHKGYKIEEGQKEKMQSMVDKKYTLNQVINEFGSPTFVNSPINDTICYVEGEGKKVAFNRFYRPTYRFLCISFENNIAQKLENMTLNKI